MKMQRQEMRRRKRARKMKRRMKKRKRRTSAERWDENKLHLHSVIEKMFSLK